MSKYQFELRRQTAAAWTAANPVLADGEPGIETDTRTWKVGDGATAWNSLAYFNPGATGATGAPGRAGAGLAAPAATGFTVAGAGSTTTMVLTSGREYSAFWTPQSDGLVDQMGFEVVTTPASGGTPTVRLAFRAESVANPGRPGALLKEFTAGTATPIDVTATGAKSSTAMTGANRLAVVGGTTYHVSLVAQGATGTQATVRALPNGAFDPRVVSPTNLAQGGQCGYSHDSITGALTDWDTTFNVLAQIPVIKVHLV